MDGYDNFPDRLMLIGFYNSDILFIFCCDISKKLVDETCAVCEPVEDLVDFGEGFLFKEIEVNFCAIHYVKIVQFVEHVFVCYLFFAICLVLVFFYFRTNVFFFIVVAVAPKGSRHDVNLQKFNINYFVLLFKSIYDRFEIIYIFY